MCRFCLCYLNAINDIYVYAIFIINKYIKIVQNGAYLIRNDLIITQFVNNVHYNNTYVTYVYFVIVIFPFKIIKILIKY